MKINNINYLLKEGIRVAREQMNKKAVYLEAQTYARGLYEKLGFRQVGLRKNYYRNPKEDALILRKEWEI